jgi:hypothetical protein
MLEQMIAGWIDKRVHIGYVDGTGEEGVLASYDAANRVLMLKHDSPGDQEVLVPWHAVKTIRLARER